MKSRTSPKRRTTAVEIATQLGISVMTVSRALNGRPNVNTKTRERILRLANKLGYVPNNIARSLVLRKTQTIGVVVPEITHSFFPEVIRGIEDVTYSTGYRLILTHSAEDGDREKEAIKTLLSNRVDGILVSTAQTGDNLPFYSEVLRSDVHLVFFDRLVEGLSASYVGIDDTDCSARVTQHLISHGYESIAHLSGPASVSIGKARLAGYRKALRKAKLPFNPDLIVQSGFQERGGYDAMKRLLSLPKRKRPDAVFAVNDPAGFGAMKAIQEQEMGIPDDLAIVGISDDIRAELVVSPLTTIRQPAYLIGKTAAETLISEIEGRTAPGERLLLKCDLIVRKSCGC